MKNQVCVIESNRLRFAKPYTKHMAGCQTKICVQIFKVLQKANLVCLNEYIGLVELDLYSIAVGFCILTFIKLCIQANFCRKP